MNILQRTATSARKEGLVETLLRSALFPCSVAPMAYGAICLWSQHG